VNRLRNWAFGASFQGVKMLREALYGVQAADVDRVAAQLAVALGLPFEKHRSLYWGDYCLYPPNQIRRAVDGKIRIYRNHDPMHQPGSIPEEEQFFEPGFQDCGVLVYAYLATEELARFREGLRFTFPNAVLIRDQEDAEPS
jgi:hypothetical protein